MRTEQGLVAHPGPATWVFRAGALAELPKILASREWRRVGVLHGERGWRAARRLLPEPATWAVEVVDAPFGGECSPEEVGRVRDLVREQDLDAVVAVGGGKVMDTAKAAGLRAGDTPVVLVPTLASNCAAWATISVLYRPDGTPIGHEVHPHPADVVLVDPRVLADAPTEYLRAGIADTLAKWYECAGGLAAADGWDLSAGMARHAARMCRDLLTEHAEAALVDAEAGVVSDDVRIVQQVVIQTAGLVGAFGGAYGRATAAHAVHDGLSALPSLRDTLHGTKVAYGVLVQLALEGRWTEVADLDVLYSRLGLPRTLDQLGVVEPEADAVATIARIAAAPGTTIHALPVSVASADVERALRELEEHERPTVDTTDHGAPRPTHH